MRRARARRARGSRRALCGGQPSIKEVAAGRWEVAGETVIMPLNAENQHQPKVFSETIKYADVARVLMR